MRNDVWKKIGYVICASIGLSLSWYVFYSLLYKFGFEQTAPKIYDNISGALGGATASIFFIKDDTKKFNIYFLIISIILAIGVYFFVYNWQWKIIMIYWM